MEGWRHAHGESADGNTFREYVTIHSATGRTAKLRASGSHNTILAYCHIAHERHPGQPRHSCPNVSETLGTRDRRRIMR